MQTAASAPTPVVVSFSTSRRAATEWTAAASPQSASPSRWLMPVTRYSVASVAAAATGAGAPTAAAASSTRAASAPTT